MAGVSDGRAAGVVDITKIRHGLPGTAEVRRDQMLAGFSEKE
jgi:hypothetical protein